jgi:hypothetical protein
MSEVRIIARNNHQVGNRNQNIIKNTLAEERLDESAARPTTVAPDVEGFEDRHSSDDCVE